MQEKRFFLFCVGEQNHKSHKVIGNRRSLLDVLRTLQNWPLCKVSGRSETIRRFTVSLMLFDKQRK